VGKKAWNEREHGGVKGCLRFGGKGTLYPMFTLLKFFYFFFFFSGKFTLLLIIFVNQNSHSLHKALNSYNEVLLIILDIDCAKDTSEDCTCPESTSEMRQNKKQKNMAARKQVGGVRSSCPIWCSIFARIK